MYKTDHLPSESLARTARAMTTVVETCRVTPPPGVAAELSLPLSFFDIIWLHFHPIRRLIFYEHPCSNAEFLNTLVPDLKQSLSLTLKHYLLVAANLLCPLDTEKRPVIRYLSGDSVTFTIAVSDRDFDELTGNHSRDSDQFYEFMPQMPPSIEEGEHKIVPLIALQATLFPGRGICIGLSNHHCLGDARSVVGFMWSWASINKFGGDAKYLSENGESLPIFDRSVLGDCSSVNTTFWNAMKTFPSKPSSFPIPTNRVRASFTLHQSDIKSLKNLVLSANPTAAHVSSFVVTAAYTWSCLVKSGDAVGDEVDENESVVMFFPADGRGRPNALVDPPVPLNYFGNCLGGGAATVEHKKLTSDDGFLIAAEAIAAQIKNKVNNKDEFLNVSDNWRSEMSKLKGLKTFGVSGSPKFDLLNADFGWGKARRLEVLSMDGENYSMSLCKSSDRDGGLVVGLSLPKERMEAFAAIFADGLSS